MRAPHVTRVAPLLAALALSGAAVAAPAPPYFAQGPKLVGGNVVGFSGSQQGTAVALSADGSTALVGGSWDDEQVGAAWVFTRTDGVWKQQQKLIGSGAAGAARQGASVALSADGSTALVGGPFDASGTGAAWVFTRAGGVFSQQGGKLVGTGGSGASGQGISVALSADGSTALVGGSGDNGGTGAAWAFRRSSGTWSAQGGKLHAADAVGAAQLGVSVALSSDGDVAIAGGPGDDSFRGAAFVFSRFGASWTQDGSKIVGGVPSVGESQGASVAISGDAGVVLSGLPTADGGGGGAYVFTRSGNIWTQRGARLTASATVGPPYLAQSIALSSDASTALLGGPFDRSTWGAAWVYGPFGTAGDANASGAVDVADVFYLISFLFAGGPPPQ